jgi:uncharacterized protein YbbK (DUF523 family)
LRKILVSACLLGEKVRWNGTDKTVGDPRLTAWIAEGRVVPLCPELAAGLAVPRPAAEIETGGSAAAVLAGQARVTAADGTDLSDAFRRGAEIAVALARAEDLRFALLTEGSPSCGTRFVADGGFAGRRVPGPGLTAAHLAAAGVACFSPQTIDALAEALAEPETTASEHSDAVSDGECPHLSQDRA